MLLSGSRSDADAGVTACAGPFGLHDGLMSATGDNETREASQSCWRQHDQFTKNVVLLSEP